MGHLFTLAIGLPLQVYVANVIGIQSLGIYGLLEGAIAVASGLLNFGAGQTVLRFVPEHLQHRDYGRIRALIRLGFWLMAGIGAAGFMLLLTSLAWIGSRWPALAAYRPEVTLMGLIFPLGLMLFFLQQSLRGFQDVRHVVIGSSFMQLSLKATLTLAAFALGFGLIGYIAATVIAMAISVLWMALGLHRHLGRLPLDPSQTCLRSWSRYAILSYAGTLASTGTASLDRFLIGAFIGTGAVGIFVVVRQLQQMPAAFNQMLLAAGAPMFAAAYSRDDRPELQHLFVVMTDWAVRISLPLLIFLFVFARPLLSLFSPEFAADGAGALRILVVAQFLNLASGPNGNVAQMCGKEQSALHAGIAAGALSALTLAVLVPRYGLAGAAIAIAIQLAATNFWLLATIRHGLGIVWGDRRYLAWGSPAAATIIVAAGLHLLGLPSGALQLASTLTGLYAVFVAVTLVQGLHEDDIGLLNHLSARHFGLRSEIDLTANGRNPFG